MTTRKFIAYAKWALPAACVWTFLLLQSTSSVLAGAPGQNQGRSQGSGASQSTTPRPPAQGRSGGPEQRSNARPEWAWWNDADIKKEIGLGEPMSKRIDDMYQKRQKALAPLVEQFIAQRDEVDRLVKEGQISVDLLTAKVIAVEALRSRLAESRTIMLYNFYKMLTPEQYSKLKNARDKHFDDLRNGRGGSPR